MARCSEPGATYPLLHDFGNERVRLRMEFAHRVKPKGKSTCVLFIKQCLWSNEAAEGIHGLKSSGTRLTCPSVLGFDVGPRVHGGLQAMIHLCLVSA